MKLFIVTGAGTASELKNFPKNLSRDQALLWIGAYLKQHSRSLAPEIKIEEREGALIIKEVGQTYHYKLEKQNGTQKI